MRVNSARFLLLGVALALFACRHSNKSNQPDGLWQMGAITTPTSSLEDQFPGQKWADSLGEGSYITLAAGKVYSGPAQEDTLLEGSQEGQALHFSFTGKSARGLSMKTSFDGAYDANTDVIDGTLQQSINLGAGSLDYSGQVRFTRQAQ